MRILLSSATFAPFRGGVARYVTGLALELARRGHRVTVVTERGGRPPVDHPRLRMVHYRGFRRSGRTFGRIARTVGSTWSVWREARDPRFDVILLATWLQHGLPVALSRRSFAMLAYGSEISIPLVRGGWRAPLLRFLVGRATPLLCISSYTESRTRALLGPACPPTVVVGCGVDPDHWRRLDGEAPMEGKYLLSVGRRSRRKGFDGLVRAFARSRWSDAGSLIVVGRVAGSSRPEATAEALGVSDRIRFAGEVSDRELAGLYRGASGFVLISDDVAGDYEGFGLVYLEAALHGVPLVAGSRGGARDLIEDGSTGLLVDPTDVDAVASALDSLLEEPGRARSLGERARARVLEEFTWSAVARNVLTALEESEAVDR